MTAHTAINNQTRYKEQANKKNNTPRDNLPSSKQNDEIELREIDSNGAQIIETNICLFCCVVARE
jgi:hypothetical protein